MKLSRICIVFILAVAVASCYRGKPSEDPPIHPNPNMDDQPKYEAQERSEFFEDGASMRSPVPGTLARGDLREDSEFYQGKDINGQLIRKMPVEIDLELLKRGQARYAIYCTPCHGGSGDGGGIVVKKGYLPPPSFHIDRLREIEDGHIYDVITNGIRNMPVYNHQIPVNDRWAIVAYVRALQRSQNATLSDVPEELRDEIK
jgi:hypothetical protein